MTGSAPVFFSNTYSKQPIYHRRAQWGGRFSHCGRADTTRGGHWLRLDHARAFGRPCKQCWTASEAPRPLVPTSHTVWRAVTA